MTGEAARGAILYGCAAVLLAAGVAWWVGAAPENASDGRIEQWREDVRMLLPDRDSVHDSDTVTLGAGTDQEVIASPGPGAFMVTVTCAGEPESRARVSLGDPGSDSGHGLRCGTGRRTDSFPVTVVDDLRMNVSVSDVSPVVFRYTLVRRVG